METSKNVTDVRGTTICRRTHACTQLLHTQAHYYTVYTHTHAWHTCAHMHTHAHTQHTHTHTVYSTHTHTLAHHTRTCTHTTHHTTHAHHTTPMLTCMYVMEWRQMQATATCFHVKGTTTNKLLQLQVHRDEDTLQWLNTQCVLINHMLGCVAYQTLNTHSCVNWYLIANWWATTQLSIMLTYKFAITSSSTQVRTLLQGSNKSIIPKH